MNSKIAVQIHSDFSYLLLAFLKRDELTSKTASKKNDWLKHTNDEGGNLQNSSVVRAPTRISWRNCMWCIYCLHPYFDIN